MNNLSVSMPGDVMTFHIIMHNEKVVTMTKPEIIEKVTDCYFMGLCDVKLAEDKTISVQHIELMRKLYSMATEEKLISWLSKYDAFDKQTVRSQEFHTDLLKEFEELSMLNADAQPKLKELHKKAVLKHDKLLTLKF